MAGMFDFKTAEDILQERQNMTRQNVVSLMANNKRGKTTGEGAASDVGSLLASLAMNYFSGGGQNVSDARAAQETVQTMQSAGVGTEGSSYGPGVMQQGVDNQAATMGLLSPDMQQALQQEQRAGQFKQAMANSDGSYESEMGLARIAMESGDTALANSIFNRANQNRNRQDALTQQTLENSNFNKREATNATQQKFQNDLATKEEARKQSEVDFYNSIGNEETPSPAPLVNNNNEARFKAMKEKQEQEKLVAEQSRIQEALRNYSRTNFPNPMGTKGR